MKKFLFLIAFVLLTTSLRAEKVVATYMMSGMERNIEAGINDRGVLSVYIQVMGEYKSENVFVRVQGDADINKFVAQLTYCRTKFIEWEEVAKKNNITDFKKEFDTTFPYVEIWWSGSKWYSSNKRNFIKPLFLVTDGKAAFGEGGEATHWDNQYIDQKFYLILNSIEEIDSLINALDVTQINKVLNQDTQADALFK